MRGVYAGNFERGFIVNPHARMLAILRDGRGETSESVARCFSGHNIEAGKMMDDRNDINRPVGSDPSFKDRTPTSAGPGYGWGIPAGIAAAVLIVAAIIFSAAGPDRSRTAAYKDTVPSAVNPAGAGDTSKSAKIPNPDMPSAPKSQ